MKTSKFLPLLIVIALAACGQKNVSSEVASATAPAATVAAPAPAPEPAAAPAPVAAAAPVMVASAADLVKGEKIYTATCLACHGAGVLGAPKFADKAAWQPRLAKGAGVLHTNALNGFNMMPAKGGNAALKDDDVKAAVDFMLSKAM